MAKNQRNYDHEFKTQAVKLAKEIGGAKAARELGILANTLHGWMCAVRMSSFFNPVPAMILDLAEGVRPNSDAACSISFWLIFAIPTHGVCC